ncbi:MAG: hypothetical protein CL823_00845 [Crocinitomicaceae bacterium]|nr:hypothetical protein [Crocinitomicaceae bacterium]
MMKLLSKLTEVRPSVISKMFWLVSALSSTSILIFFSGICWNFELNQVQSIYKSNNENISVLNTHLDRYEEIKSEYLELTDVLLAEYLSQSATNITNLTKPPFSFTESSVRNVSPGRIHRLSTDKIYNITQSLESCEGKIILSFRDASSQLESNYKSINRFDIGEVGNFICNYLSNDLNDLNDCFKNHISNEIDPHEGYTSMYGDFVDWSDKSDVLVSNSNCFEGVSIDTLIKEKDYKVYGLMIVLFLGFLFPLMNVKQPVIKGRS